jgi:RimJ/RimL family protein N-acetyltransferase
LIVSGNEVGKWVCEKIGSDWIAEGAACIGEAKEGKLVSGVFYNHYNGASIFATIATDKSLSRTFTKAILSYPFDVLKVNCIIVQVSSKNVKSIKLANHLGFKQIGSIPSAMTDGDMVILSLVKQHCIKFME